MRSSEPGLSETQAQGGLAWKHSCPLGGPGERSVGSRHQDLGPGGPRTTCQTRFTRWLCQARAFPQGRPAARPAPAHLGIAGAGC